MAGADSEQLCVWRGDVGVQCLSGLMFERTLATAAIIWVFDAVDDPLVILFAHDGRYQGFALTRDTARPSYRNGESV